MPSGIVIQTREVLDSVVASVELSNSLVVVTSWKEGYARYKAINLLKLLLGRTHTGTALSNTVGYKI